MESYNENGNLSSIQQYDHNWEKTGKWVYYNMDGSPFVEVYYDKGEKIETKFQ